jgi:hypothetical protein
MFLKYKKNIENSHIISEIVTSSWGLCGRIILLRILLFSFIWTTVSFKGVQIRH